MKDNGLAYSYLNDKDKACYEIIFEALKKHAKSASLSGVFDQKYAETIAFRTIADNPQFINLNRTRAYFKPGLKGLEVCFDGIIDEATSKRRIEALDKVVEDAMFEIDKDVRSDKDLIIGIYNYLQAHCEYDDAELQVSMSGKTRNRDAHSAYGALVEGKALCSGFASAFYLLLSEFGMRSMIVDGKARYNGVMVDHSWNIVEYNGELFQMDITWDANLYRNFSVPCYSYFALTDDEMSIDHEWDLNAFPVCKSDKLEYYKSNGLIAQSLSDVTTIMARQFAADGDSIRLKMAPGVAIPGDANQFFQKAFTDAMVRAHKTQATFGFYWDDVTQIFTGVPVNE